MIDKVDPNLLGLRQSSPLQGGQSLKSPKETVKGNESDFEQMLARLVAEVDQKQKIADQAISQLATGKEANIHDVVMKLEEAELTFQLMKEIRDKLVAAYKEVMGMQA